MGPPDGIVINLSTRVVVPTGVVNPNDSSLCYDPVPEGLNIGVAFFLNQAGVADDLQQTLTDTLQLNTIYTLTVEVGNMAPVGGPYDFTGLNFWRAVR